MSTPSFDRATLTRALSDQWYQLARLRGGRNTADAHGGEFAITGDTELGDRLVRNLAFTI
ncbi:hypothetical protein [Nocardia thraciensis]